MTKNYAGLKMQGIVKVSRTSQPPHFYSRSRLTIGLLLAGWLFGRTPSPAANFPTNFPSVDDLPVCTNLPDALVTSDGKIITTPGEWQSHREQLKQIIEHYALGHAPPPPGNVIGQALESKILADGKVRYHRVRLMFGPEKELGFDISIFVPAETNGIQGPFPTIIQPSFSRIGESVVFGTNTVAAGTNSPTVKKSSDSHSVSPEAAASQYAQALNRGYAVVTFYYQDCGQDSSDYRKTGFFPAYPDYDWADLSAWAWGMSRCVDYLETQSFADKSKFIALGHSRLGKATLVAGAFDERFALVAPAGSGCAGTGAYRFNGKARTGREGLNEIVKNFPQWTIPSLVEFSNRVERLPFDQHWLIDLVAPRLFIAPDGLNDSATSINALIQSYLGAKPVYALLGVPEHLCINFRPGPHRLAPEDWTAVLDFADQQLRGKDVKRVFNQLPVLN